MILSSVLSQIIKAKPPKMLDYTGKLALAPMVRSGELPTRLMSLRNGADLVWGPEIVDKKLIRCSRVEEPNNIIKFIEKDSNRLVFKTDRKEEAGKLVFQLGTADIDLAVQAAKMVAKDVDAIDLNCGCPKPFSTHSGMGAALLSNPKLLTGILEALVTKVGKVYGIPISAKIRLMDENDPLPTLELIDKICATGISNLTLHCRTRNMRNREKPVHDFLDKIVARVHKNNVSFIINGAIHNRVEFEMLQEVYGKEVGAMLAENAECNPTSFSKTPKSWRSVAREFVETAIECDNHPSNTKYILLNQIPGKSKYYQEICKAKTNESFLQIIKRIDEGEDHIRMRYLQKDILISAKEFQNYTYQISAKRKLAISEEPLAKKLKCNEI